MKIAFLGDIRSVHVLRFIEWFARKGNDAILVSFDYPDDVRQTTGLHFCESLDIPVSLIPKRKMVLAPSIATDIIRKFKPDLVQCHFLTHYGFIGAYVNKHPLVMSAMGDDILIHPEQTARALTVWYALRKADAVTVDGQNSLIALKKMGIPDKKVHLIYPGINMAKFHPSRRRPLDYQQVFYPRGFDKVYDVDTVFDVVRIVNQNLPDVKFALMGIGTEQERFGDMIRGAGLMQSVNFLGNVPDQDVPYHFASSDVSFTCSLSDGGIPVSTIEAMASGTPVVSTDAGDARLWIKPGKTGYVVPCRDSAGMAACIIDILNDDTERVRMGAHARRFVEDRYDYHIEMGKIEKLYESLL